MIHRLKSFLFVPGDNPQRIAKAALTPADAIIVDLEDAVAPASKHVARAGLTDARKVLARSAQTAIVRINANVSDHEADLQAVLECGFDAIMIPKVESPADLQSATQAISQRMWRRQARPPSLIALIESPRGVLAAADVAALPRISALAFGTEDFALAMGVAPSACVLDLPVRQLALAAHAHRKAALAMPLSIADFRDSDRVLEAARMAASYGCTGALCIHPNQIGAINAAFGPDDEDLAEAQAILAAWGQAQSAGSAVAKLNGKMIDHPVVARAERILDRAGCPSEAGISR